VRIVPLAAVAREPVDMLTILIVGNSQTRQVDRRLVTPRGYSAG
jgi:precorrin-3B methylase